MQAPGVKDQLVITISKCGSTHMSIQQFIHLWTLKKLKQSVDNCSKFHLGNKASETTCLKHTVQGVEMRNKKSL